MRRVLLLASVLMVLVAACGGQGELEVKDAWARTSATMQDAGAVYMTIAGGDDADQLTAASVASSVAAMAELHETAMTESEGGTEMMMMQPVSSIAVPADGEAVLEPGGYHIMMMQLAEPLTVGSEFTITLTFENAGAMDVTVAVRDG